MHEKRADDVGERNRDETDVDLPNAADGYRYGKC